MRARQWFEYGATFRFERLNFGWHGGIGLALCVGASLCLSWCIQAVQQFVSQSGVWITASTDSLSLAISAALAALGAILSYWWGISFLALALTHTLPTSSSVRRVLHQGVQRWAPRTVRKVALVSVGVGLFLGAGSAHAADTTEPPLGWAVTTDYSHTSALPGGPVSSPTVTAPTPSPPPEIVAPTAMTVQPGDSLWRLAAASLEPHASAQQISTAWQSWYDLNRSTIGDDPNTLVPGQILQVPAQSSNV